MRMKKYILMLLAVIILISSPACRKDPYHESAHGSAVALEGKVILVSIFADDSLTQWNYESDADLNTIYGSLANLKIATDYLSQQVTRFGKQISFVYDWEADNDLFFRAYFDSELVRSDGSMYYKQDEWLVKHIDTSYLLKKYDADHIIFNFFFNTDYDNTVRSWSMNNTIGYAPVPREFTNFYLKNNGHDLYPGSYAHEIMHAFGAPDLYYANDLISQEYVDHLANTASKDIMFLGSWSSSKITREFSDLDAYYVGIAPRPAEADQWSLARSEHDLN